MKLIERLSTAARKRVEYKRTVAELSRMSPSTASDLGIADKDVRAVAHQAVYGV